MNIHVHIERLILDGLPVTVQGPLVQAAVESELVRLLDVDGLSPDFRSSRAIHRLSGGTIQPTSETKPADLGYQIARAVCGGIRQGISVSAQNNVGKTPSPYRSSSGGGEPTNHRL